MQHVKSLDHQQQKKASYVCFQCVILLSDFTAGYVTRHSGARFQIPLLFKVNWAKDFKIAPLPAAHFCLILPEKMCSSTFFWEPLFKSAIYDPKVKETSLKKKKTAL